MCTHGVIEDWKTVSGCPIKDFGHDGYGWETEFSDPPHGLKEPYPRDWLVTAQKLQQV